MGGVAFAASVFPLAALPSIEEAVFRPVAGHGAEDGDLRADAVEQPVGEIRGVERLVIQMGFFREHIQAGGDVAGHSQSVWPPVRIHVPKVFFRQRHIREVPGEDICHRSLFSRRERERHGQCAVHSLPSRRRTRLLASRNSPGFQKFGFQCFQAFPVRRDRRLVVQHRERHVAIVGGVFRLAGGEM